MPPSPSSPTPRILFLLNPGRQSRFYLLGLARAAQTLGYGLATVELHQLWQHLNGAGEPGRVDEVRRQLSALVRTQRITHAIGYGFNGAVERGLVQPGADGRPEPILAGLGVRHLMLWTDHPEWLLNGCAIASPVREILGHANHVHFLKSPAAAHEAAHVLGWPNVHSIPMAEDYELLKPAPAPNGPVHDAVAIIGGAEPIPAPIAGFLSHDDPPIGEMIGLMAPAALHALERLAVQAGEGADQRAALASLGEAWIERKRLDPLAGFHELSVDLQPRHGTALRWLAADPQRWYAGVAALRRCIGWRRNFWLAWLGRRVDLGLYGAPAATLGLTQPPGAEAWVEYQQQPAVYSRGRCALNINAAWDEHGATHKPFQIAASGVACVHHESRGVSDLFTPGTEIELFDSGPGLLGAVRLLSADSKRREDLAHAMRSRAMREHRWDDRLGLMLRLAEHRAASPAIEITGSASRSAI